MSQRQNDKPRDSVESVRTWLLEQGFPLEMRVAEELRRAGFSTQQSVFYTDSESNKPREIDIVADRRYEWRMLSAGIRFVFVIECKRATAKPWVFLSTPEARSIAHDRFEINAGGGGRTLVSNLDQIKDLPADGVFLGPERSAYGLTTAHKDSNQKDDAYSACLALVSALRDWKDAGEVRDHLYSLDGVQHWAHIRIPLIVVEGPLFDAHLNDSGDLIVTAVDRGRLTAGFGGEIDNPTIIDVVRVDGLTRLLQAFQAEVALIENACKNRPEILTKSSLGALDILAELSASDGEGEEYELETRKGRT